MKASLTKSESGVALVTALLVLALASALMAGMFASLLANQRSHATDRDQSLAYAAAHAGLEKLTAGLAGLFQGDFSPNAAQVGSVAGVCAPPIPCQQPPTIPGFEYTIPGGAAGSGYQITFTPDPGPGPNTGNPLSVPNADITTGPFEGFKGLITPYTLTVTARSTTGNSEVRLRRELQTVAVPVFQFGIFGQNSLGFHAGPNFDFGGRVHTNQSLYLASGDSSTLTFRDKITAFTQVVRNTLSNGVSITLTNHEGNVSIPRVIGGSSYRNLLSTENSGTTAVPWAGWKNLSEVIYRTNIRTEATGARQLNLPLTSAGLGPIELIRRPGVGSNENVANAVVFSQRYFAQASLRILLSDRAADITDLPTVTAGAPLQLDGPGPAGYVPAAGRPPIPQSYGPEPVALVNPANGQSWTRASAVGAATGPTTLTIQTWNTGTSSWNAAAVPNWLKVTSIQQGATVINCTTFSNTQLTGCGNHPALAAGTALTFTRGFDNTTFTINVAAGGSTLNNPIINLASSFARRFPSTTVIYVGEDPVTCTGFNATQLTGCTWPSTSTINANDPVYTGYTTAAATPLLNGYIKIEKQNAAGVWSDVTLELLNLGFAGPNLQGDSCGDPTPDAVIRLMRYRDNGMPANGCVAGGAGSYRDSLVATDYYPNLIYDAREGNTRLVPTTDGPYEGGLFGYVAIDMRNFSRWVAGTIGATGNQALNNNGYIIYFSDRRGDHDETKVGDPESGEYGNEDSINPANQAWAKNNVLDAGEDFNENNTLQTYGETPHPLAVPGTAMPNMQFDATARPWTQVPLKHSGRGRVARPVLFRRALKVINGGMGNLPTAGITVTSENPIYVQGNYNANSTDVTAEPNVAAALIGDSITLLSNNFRDTSTFQYPNDETNRNAADTGYRFAMVTGKSIPFPKPAGWGVNELGSDGGVHNFMRMLEDWAGTTLRYRGSMVSLYYSRQSIGIYRADANIYGAPTRGYNFDTDFLTPALLPPGTPMFRDINTLKFRQILRPNQ